MNGKATQNHPTRHDIYVHSYGDLPIYITPRLSAGELIVYALTYTHGISISDAVVLYDTLEKLGAIRYIQALNELDIGTAISYLSSRVFSRVQNNMALDFSAIPTCLKFIEPDELRMEFNLVASICEHVFTSAHNQIELVSHVDSLGVSAVPKITESIVECAIDLDVAKTTRITSDHNLTLSEEITACTVSRINALESELMFGTDIEILAGHFTRLFEIDDQTLVSLDTSPLSELDYIFI